MLAEQTTQELMTPKEAARWFRRSTSWVRQQRHLLRLGGPAGQPLYHVRACRAYLLALSSDCAPDELRRLQVEALASDCGLRGFGQSRAKGTESASHDAGQRPSAAT